MPCRTFYSLLSLLLLCAPAAVMAKTVNYDLNLSEMTVYFSGKERRAMAINGSIPGPTLRFTEGDDAVLRVRNDLKKKPPFIGTGCWCRTIRTACRT